MKRSPLRRLGGLVTLTIGGTLLATGNCVPQDVAGNIAQTAATRAANMILDALFFTPLEDTLDRSTGQVEE